MFEDDTWRLQRDFYMGMLANGYTKKQLEDLDSECESLIKILSFQAKMLQSSFLARAFYDFALRYVNND